MPFASPERLQDHWLAHRAEFDPPPATPTEYEALADAFLLGERVDPTKECTRPSGPMCRYNPETEEYGVLSEDGVVITYFVADPAIHEYATNEDYFNARCKD